MRELDLRSKGIVTDRGALQYDYLILALGSVPNFFGVEGAASQSFPLRTMDDAIPLRYQVLACFERAAQEPDPEERRALLRFAIVGGGHTGVEYAGALAELIYGPLLKDYREIPPEEVDVTLLEGGDRLLPGMPVRLQEYARARLEKRGVRVRTGSKVLAVQPEVVETSGDGKLPTHTVVWAAGVQGDPMAARWGLPTGPSGRVPVEATLQVSGHPEVFVVGDLAFLEDEGRPLPQVAQVALQQGRGGGQHRTDHRREGSGDVCLQGPRGSGGGRTERGGGQRLGKVLHRLGRLGAVADNPPGLAYRIPQPGAGTGELGLELCVLSACGAVDPAGSAEGIRLNRPLEVH